MKLGLLNLAGSIFRLIFSHRLNPRAAWISGVAVFLLLVAGFYLKDLPSSSLSIPQEELSVVRTIPGYNTYFCCIEFTADGQRLAIANSSNVHILQTDSGKVLHRFESLPRTITNIEENDIRAIALTRDGTTLATAAEEMIKIIDVKTGKRLHELAGGYAVQFTPDGRTVVGFTGKTDDRPGILMQIWDVKSGAVRHTIPLEQARLDIKSPVFDITPDGKTLVIAPAFNNDRIELWDLTTGKRL